MECTEMILPNTWGQGALFSYSGVYGKKVPGESLEGRLLADRFAIEFETTSKFKLFFENYHHF